VAWHRRTERRSTRRPRAGHKPAACHIKRRVTCNSIHSVALPIKRRRSCAAERPAAWRDTEAAMQRFYPTIESPAGLEETDSDDDVRAGNSHQAKPRRKAHQRPQVRAPSLCDTSATRRPCGLLKGASETLWARQFVNSNTLRQPRLFVCNALSPPARVHCRPLGAPSPTTPDTQRLPPAPPPCAPDNRARTRSARRFRNARRASSSNHTSCSASRMQRCAAWGGGAGVRGIRAGSRPNCD
jgi:hypothetical protein